MAGPSPPLRARPRSIEQPNIEQKNIEQPTMLKCIIVDDEESAIQVLKMHMQAINCLQLVHATTNPLEAIGIINEQQIPLAFLDIHMPDITGLELAKALQGKCRVIFTTGYSEFVSDAYDLDVGVIDYLLKPIPLPRFIRAVQRAINVIAPAMEQQAAQALLQAGGQNSLAYDYIYVRTTQKDSMLRILLAHIDYIEANKKYVDIYHLGQKTMALLSMKEIEEKLPSKYFMRVQKSFIVSLPKITTVNGARLRLQNTPVEITVGEVYKAQFMEAMKKRLL
jgi:two-component system, LytTR family, response regulator